MANYDVYGVDTVKTKNLSEIDNIRYMDRTGIDLSAIKDVITKTAEDGGFDVGIIDSNISSGGLFGSKTPCIVCYRPEHLDDYFYYVISLSEQGKGCIVHIGLSGKSRLMKNEEYLTNTKILNGSGTAGTVVGVLRGGAVGTGFAIGSAVGGILGAGGKALKKGFLAMTTNQADLQAEKDWYDSMMYIFGQVFA